MNELSDETATKTKYDNHCENVQEKVCTNYFGSFNSSKKKYLYIVLNI